jgi:hypothetical protein
MGHACARVFQNDRCEPLDKVRRQAKDSVEWLSGGGGLSNVGHKLRNRINVRVAEGNIKTHWVVRTPTQHILVIRLSLNILNKS